MVYIPVVVRQRHIDAQGISVDKSAIALALREAFPHAEMILMMGGRFVFMRTGQSALRIGFGVDRQRIVDFDMRRTNKPFYFRLANCHGLLDMMADEKKAEWLRPAAKLAA